MGLDAVFSFSQHSFNTNSFMFCLTNAVPNEDLLPHNRWWGQNLNQVLDILLKSNNSLPLVARSCTDLCGQATADNLGKSHYYCKHKSLIGEIHRFSTFENNTY